MTANRSRQQACSTMVVHDSSHARQWSSMAAVMHSGKRLSVRMSGSKRAQWLSCSSVNMHCS
ncbi:hypothetical protein AMTR_s00028p00106170 [Amborella trichopoda]|uniref:Uncharacterized protein n=1 Tax=Amborella trichopoda TaxID=13333 RepID=W1PRA2_AMBTC|nr:hypothetical protein AMTR_s00028p00106170 [Amborella trichopoda]